MAYNFLVWYIYKNTHVALKKICIETFAIQLENTVWRGHVSVKALFYKTELRGIFQWILYAVLDSVG